MRILNLLVTLAVVGALMSLGSLFSSAHMLLDIGAQFRLQYIALLLPAVLLAVIGKRFVATVVLFAVMVVHAYAIGAALQSVAVEQHDNYVDLRIVSANVLFTNKNHQEFLSLIDSLEPDVLAIQEYTPQWHQALSANLAEFPHRITEPLPGGFGIALYSRHSIASGGIVKLGNGNKPSIDVELAVGDKVIHVVNVHPPPPSTQAFYEERNELMVDLALTTRRKQRPVVVTGDFNATPWTAHFTDMENASGLRNARRGVGIAATWPDKFFPLLLPIDHMLVSNSIDVASFRSMSVSGSDHRAISADLRIYFPGQ